MSTPIVEYISENILTAINAITTGNGFNQTLVAQRPKRMLFLDEAWDDLTVIVEQANESVTTIIMNAREVTQSYEISAIVISSDDASATIDTRLNQVDADIKKKLMADNTRGGYAIDTEIQASEKFTYNESFSGIIINVDVKYRIKIDDPYTQG